jgi:putative transcriptional regulator
MKKRDLFAEITEGFEALAEERAGKLTLRTHEMEWLPTPEVTADELVALRTRLHLSRPVFARYLRTNPRTCHPLLTRRRGLTPAISIMYIEHIEITT